MKQAILFFFTLLLLSSCATMNRIIEIEDSYKEITGLKLIQNPDAYSSEKIRNFGGRKHYNINSHFLFENQKNGQATLVLEFHMTTQVDTDELDSILFFDLDHERIKLISTENNSFQLMKREFIVPENLWVSIAHSQEIYYRLYVGKDGVDVKLSASEISRVKEFFNRAIGIRDANLPAIPEGQKKW